jgi:PAS domain S-box-containing protein
MSMHRGKPRFVCIAVRSCRGTQSLCASPMRGDGAQTRRSAVGGLRESAETRFVAPSHEPPKSKVSEMSEEHKMKRSDSDAVRRSANRLASALKESSKQVLCIDDTGAVIRVTRHASEILGYARQELARRNAVDVGLLKQPELHQIRGLMAQAQRRDSEMWMEAHVACKDSTVLRSLLAAEPNRETRSVEGCFYILTAVAERERAEKALRASEAHYRLLADNVMDVIWTMEYRGHHLHFTYLSPSVKRLLGFSVEEAVAIEPSRAIRHSSWIEAMKVQAHREGQEWKGHKGEGSPVTFEAEVYRKDGSVIWTETAITPLQDARGMTTGLLGVTRDISERKKSEEKLRQLYKQERELREQLESEMNRRVEFTRALAHELKTPLTPVLASVESLLSEIHDERLASLARNISRGATNLDSRIDELLDLAKGEIGMLQLSPESIDLLPLLREMAEAVSPLAESHGQSLITDLPDHLCTVRADVSRVRQILLNLLENAVKFTPKGGKITLKATEKDGMAIFEVKDTGRGMTMEEQNRLFEPYHRLVSDRSRFSGLGLGLALCRTLVDLHHGQIWVRSQPGKGSTFLFSLPLESGGHEPHDAQVATKLWKVLIIEDDREIIDSISLAFERDWPEAALVSTGMGEEGIEMVETQEPDIVILDLGLPDTDGLEILKAIRLFSAVPVVILTVRGEERDVTRGLDCGANDYITKPFRKLELLSRLKSQLRKHAHSDEEEPIVCGTLRLEPSTYQLSYGKKEISLTVVEGRILEHLMKNAGHVTTCSRLTEAVWGEDYPGAIESLRVYIGYLRAKLELDPKKPRLIRTKAGVGYSLMKPD